MPEFAVEDFELLTLIASNSGRQSYITNGEFEQLWTNSDIPLVSAAASMKVPVYGRAIRKETVFPCTDGRAMKITPVMRDGRPRLYFFELYGSNELIGMLAATSVFGKFSAAADRIHSMMLGYAASLSASAGEVNDSEYGKLCSSTVNFMSLLKILGDREPLVIEDISARLTQIAGWFARAARRSGSPDFEYDIDEELLAPAGRNSLEYAVVNLLVNAAMHGVPAEGKKLMVRLTAYLDHGRVCMVIEDSGTKADPDHVNSFREAFSSPEKTDSGEGLGIALAENFCRHSGGELVIERSPLGGLRTELRLPSCSENERYLLYAPSLVCPDMQGIADIFKKHFEPSAVREIIETAEHPCLMS